MNEKSKRVPLPHMHPEDKDKFADVVADTVIQEINAHRKAKGLPPLKEK